MPQQYRTPILTFVWCLIFSEFFLFTYTWVIPFFPNLLCCIIVVIFYPLFLLLVISYCQSILIAPGYPNKHQEQQLLEGRVQQIKERALEIRTLKQQSKLNKQLHKIDQIALLKQISYCFKCKSIKPIRTHHCSICNKCILRMDHHCPWVGNCVGLKNHKLFLLFLFYATFQLTLIWVIMGLCQLIYDHQSLQTNSSIYIITQLIALGLSLSIGFLLVSQIYNFYRGITTLQSFTQGMGNSRIFHRGSFINNLKEVMKDEFWWWPYQLPFEI